MLYTDGINNFIKINTYMKKILLLFFLMLIFTNCKDSSHTVQNILVSNVTNSNIDTIQGIKTLKEFYLKFYGSDTIFDDKNLKRKFVSERIIKRIDSLSDEEDLILDYDPFIQGQDYFGHIIRKTLEIKPLKNKDEYRVSFLLFGEKNEKRTCVDFLLKKVEKENFLIYSILNDEYLNFNNDNIGLNNSNKDTKESIDLNSIKNENELGKLIFYKNKNNQLVIREDLLSQITKLSSVDHGKKASLLRSYVTQLLIERKQKAKIPYTDKELYRIIAYTINTSDPIYYKYYDYDDVFWGKYSMGGDSHGGTSFSNALSLGNLLSVKELDVMTAQFRANNYYNLPNLKNMLRETIWCEV
jgi:hypothetical protein